MSTYWDPVSERNVDVTEATPLPVGMLAKRVVGLPMAHREEWYQSVAIDTSGYRGLQVRFVARNMAPGEEFAVSFQTIETLDGTASYGVMLDPLNASQFLATSDGVWVRTFYPGIAGNTANVDLQWFNVPVPEQVQVDIYAEVFNPNTEFAVVFVLLP
jgi:hypothetical protein